MESIEIADTVEAGREHLEAMERGNILFFPLCPFSIKASDRDALLSVGQADGNFHKNIAFRPSTGAVTGLGKTTPPESARVRQAMKNYSRDAIAFMERFLRPYKSGWRTDYASFRSIEEEGRNLPVKKRNDLLHTDAFPTRPTNGGMILRFFTNIHPGGKTRDWTTSDPFAALAPRYAFEAGLSKSGSVSEVVQRAAIRAGKAAGLPLVDRSPYDRFMLVFHDFLKRNDDYQRTCPKYHFNFQPGSAWMVFTDVVPHAVMAGRYALEQTTIISRETLVDRGNAPASILEALTGRKLTYPV